MYIWGGSRNCVAFSLFLSKVPCYRPAAVKLRANAATSPLFKINSVFNHPSHRFGAEAWNWAIGVHVCAGCESNSTGKLDYVYGRISRTDLWRASLFYRHLYPILSNPVSEKIHLSAYCYSCLIHCRILPPVSYVGTFLRGFYAF